MAALSAFYPYIGPYAIGVPDPTFERALLDTAASFCRDSLVLQESKDLSIVANTPTITLTASTGFVPVKVMSMRIGSQDLIPEPQDRLTDYYGADWRVSTGPQPRYFTQDSETLLRVVPYLPAGAATQAAVAQIAVAPSRSVTTLPDALLDTWIDAMVAGTLSRLYAIPNQPFTDKDSSVVQARIYNYQLSKAKIAVTESFTRAPLAVRPVPGW
jgi:hypothetical protein